MVVVLRKEWLGWWIRRSRMQADLLKVSQVEEFLSLPSVVVQPPVWLRARGLSPV